MKHLRVTAGVVPADAPAFFTLLAHSDAVSEARVLDWNEARPDVMTLLFAIDGDASPFAASATETPGVQSVDLSEPEGGRTYALVEARPLAMPLFSAIHRARARGGLVVRKPIVYRDGTLTYRVVGDPEALGAAMAETPDDMDVRVEEVGTLRGDYERPGTRLTERQREALEVARDLGYYDPPRGATHADVAAALGCAPATATVHLQKAEAKLVRAALDEFGSSG
jgi:hypothetical protein